MSNTGRAAQGKVYTARGSLVPPSFQDIGTNSGLTNHGVVLGQGAGPFVTTAEGLTGQVFTGVTGGDPVWAAPAVSNDYHDTRFIVGASAATGANYTTIASAVVDAAAAGGIQTIWIQPGTYTENITVTTALKFIALYPQFRDDAKGVTVIGKFTCATASTDVGFFGIQFRTNADVSLSVTANSSSITCQNCYFDATNANSIAVTGNTSTNVYIENCSGSIANAVTLFTATNGLVWVKNSTFINVSGTPAASTASTSAVRLIDSFFSFPFSTSSTGEVLATNCQFGTPQSPYINTTWITTAGTATSQLRNCYLHSGTASAVSAGAGTIIIMTGCLVNSSNTNAITGAGQVSFVTCTFNNTSSTINTTTQVPLVATNDALKVTTPAAYPYTTVPQDAVILVDTSSARTITPLASPTTGQKHIIKDSVGSAAANNITVTPSGKNIDGAASYTLNVAYGSITIVFGGTEWHII